MHPNLFNLVGKSRAVLVMSALFELKSKNTNIFTNKKSVNKLKNKNVFLNKFF